MADENWQQIRKIFDDALRQKPEERRKFVNEACGNDKTLLREVESLLLSLDSAESFMEIPAVAKVADVIEPETKKLGRGICFTHYEIIEQIGAGGMGEVYLARDKKLDRKVAIKVLNEKFAGHESNLQRFFSEAKAASGLNHPNILTIYEFGESEDAHFIVSEFINGKTLREIFKEKPLKLTEVLDFFIQIAGALVAAHEAHLVHRDIKPENIMVRPDGFVKILDFGLAKLVGQPFGLDDTTTKQNATAKGIILGTVNYMSPEQAKGERVDERTDIFSLGTVIYEMIAGRTPFAGGSVSETCANLINREPQPLSRFAANVPDELQRIVSKTLRKNRDARYQTMKDLLTDLRELKETIAFDEKLERSQPPNDNATAILQATTGDANLKTVERQNSFSQKIRQKPFAAFVIIALLIGAIGFGFWYFGNRTVRQIESIAVMPFINESGNADVEYLSDGMTETLISSLSQLPKLNVKARSSVFRYKGKETDAQTISKELDVQAILNGRIIQRGDQLTLSLELINAQTENVIWSQQYNRKQADLVSLQSEIARDVSSKIKTRLSGADEQKVAKTYTTNPEAYQLYLKGRYQWNKRTGESLKIAVEFFNQAIEKDPGYALAYSGLAESYVLFPLYNLALPLDSMPKAKAAALRAIELDDSLAEAHVALGIYYSNFAWNQPAAEKEFRRAIELNPNYANAHQQFGVECLTAMGRFEEAVAEGKRAEELDPLSPIISVDLGLILIRARRFDEALAQLNRVLTLDPNFWLVYCLYTHLARLIKFSKRGSSRNGTLFVLRINRYPAIRL